MLVGIDLVPSPGHDIALQRDLSGAVFLFDPNLGVYKITQLKLVVLALMVLLDLGYAGTASDGKVTALGSHHDWQVFAKVDAGLPQILPGQAFANDEQVRIACDEAQEIIDGFIEAAREGLDGVLREAQKAHLEYKAKGGTAAHTAWKHAHNESVTAFNFIRGADMQKAKAIYPEFQGIRYAV
jgi:hypothetical protein